MELRGCKIKWCDSKRGFGIFSDKDVCDGNINMDRVVGVGVIACYLLEYHTITDILIVCYWKVCEFLLMPFC